jgi:hypothetical protein
MTTAKHLGLDSLVASLAFDSDWPDLVLEASL